MTKGRLEAFTDGVIAVRIACGLYVLVAAIWLVPDRRFEKLFAESR